MDRRGFLAGIIAASVAPAFIKTAGLLMPIKPTIVEPMMMFPQGWDVQQAGKLYVATFQLVYDTDVRTEGMVKIA